ncbi:hypothetical protein EDB86DRAFT_2914001 [Lactarius hatsudake]|nr:hypothetical protein EDB86DRAFT_2914001 [Lactarius hatsudake]
MRSPVIKDPPLLLNELLLFSSLSFSCQCDSVLDHRQKLQIKEKDSYFHFLATALRGESRARSRVQHTETTTTSLCSPVNSHAKADSIQARSQSTKSTPSNTRVVQYPAFGLETM